MGLETRTNGTKTFLSVGYGTIRQKQVNGQPVDANTPNAVKRVSEKGEESWSIEHRSVTGYIEKIFLKENKGKDGKDFGDSFEVVISDALDTYQISFKEDSRFWTDLMKKLPNIDLSKEVKIAPYDFNTKEGKRQIGTSVEQNGVKIRSFFDLYKEDKTWELLHGFPSAEGINFKDKDDIKLYGIKVKKFLHQYFMENFDNIFKEKKKTKVEESEEPAVVSPGDDLPF